MDHDLDDDGCRPFDELFARHHRDILAYALRRCPTPQDAEDLAAETFAVAWRRRDDLPPPDEVRLWLFGTARLIRMGQHRSQRRRNRLLARLASTFSSTTVGWNDDWAHDQPAVRAAFNTLSDADRDLLGLQAWEGLSGMEIAEILGISTPAVWKRLERARNRFRHAYAQTPGTKMHGAGTASTTPCNELGRPTMTNHDHTDTLTGLLGELDPLDLRRDHLDAGPRVRASALGWDEPRSPHSPVVRSLTRPRTVAVASVAGVAAAGAIGVAAWQHLASDETCAADTGLPMCQQEIDEQLVLIRDRGTDEERELITDNLIDHEERREIAERFVTCMVAAGVPTAAAQRGEVGDGTEYDYSYSYGFFLDNPTDTEQAVANEALEDCYDEQVAGGPRIDRLWQLQGRLGVGIDS